MALNNAERQRRHIARLKARAGVAQPQSPKPKHEKLARVDFPLSGSLFRWVEAWCKRHKLTFSEGVRRIVRERMARDKGER